MRVLLLGLVQAEDGHHRVADVLLDHAAVRRDVLLPALEVRVDDRADVLGVERLGHHREVDEIGEQHRDELALLDRGPVYQSVALLEQRLDRRVDHRVAEHRPLGLEGRDGTVDRRQLVHIVDTNESAAVAALAGFAGRTEHSSSKPRERIVARCSITGRFDAHRQRLERGREGGRRRLESEIGAPASR